MKNINDKFSKMNEVFEKDFSREFDSDNWDNEFTDILDSCEDEENKSSFKTIFEILNNQIYNYEEKIHYHSVSADELKEIIKYAKFIVMAKFIINIEGDTNIFRMLVDKDVYEDDFNIEGNNLFELISCKNRRDEEKKERKYKDKNYILEENRYKYLCRNIKKRFKFLDIKDNKNFSGKQIYMNSMQELDAIEYIWEKNKSENLSEEKKKKINSARKAYKHLGSSHIEKITYKNLNELHEFFMQMIEDSGYQFKNIYYYKLEKKMGYYLIKNTLKNINKLKSCESKKLYSFLTMIYIWQIPMLSIREKLSDELFDKISKGNNNGIENFKTKIKKINMMFSDVYNHTAKVINKSIQARDLLYKYDDLNTNDFKFRASLDDEEIEALRYIEDSNEIKIKDCTESELEEFRKIFNFKDKKSEFSNEFKIKKDYNKEDVDIFFGAINKLNKYIDNINSLIEL